MIAIISPAKNMKKQSYKEDIPISRPIYREQTKMLWNKLRQYQPHELETLLQANEKLSAQAFMDFQDFDSEARGTPAMLYYDGLVFKNIDAQNLTREQLLYADKSVRILSGFYGMLRPLDGILPYRLEMQCRLRMDEKASNLYQFWKDELYQELYRKPELVVNLASEEYAKCIRKYLQPQDQFLDIEFYTIRGGKKKNITAWAKMARGQMVRYIVENEIENPSLLKEFNWNGYAFEESLSHEQKYVFLKHHTLAD